MKIWVVISGVASTLFVASILTFGLSTEIASAHGTHPDGECTGPHKKEPACDGGGSVGDEPMSTFTVAVTIGEDSVDCSDENCTSKPIRDDRLDRTTGLVVRGMDMTVPLQAFLAAQFDDDCFDSFNLDMDGGLSIFEPRASPRTIFVGYSFQGLHNDGTERDYDFDMFCEIPDDTDADWVPTGDPVTVTCQHWILTSRGSLDSCEQETQKMFDVEVTVEVSGPTSVN